jgi:UDP-2,4-diacetamido-2,4,6-trideoxy-beta-L-altropyranose hydrolase
MLRVAFRVDASLSIGTGHVMRCLALANGLRQLGAECYFICREYEGHLEPLIAAAGFRTTMLPAAAGMPPAEPPAHAARAGGDWARDAAETSAALARKGADWLVVDHYAFDARWESASRPEGTALLVLDDLADRRHDCDLLVDQNLGRLATDYEGLVPAGVPILVGPAYALLRPDFAERRAESLARRVKPRIQRILVTLGGVDLDDVTGRVLDALEKSTLPPDTTVTVVMGPTAPWLDLVCARAMRMRHPTEVVVGLGAAEMAQLMVETDLAIGAGGTTTWERCVLGVPSLILQIADNQAGLARALVAEGAAVDPGPPDGLNFTQRLVDCLGEVDARLGEISAKAASICDGDGLGRVLSRMLTVLPSFRPAGMADARRVWEWRAAGDPARFSRSGTVPVYAEHHAWFTAALQDRKRIFRVLMLGLLACGYLRLDHSGANRATVSLCLARDMRGQKLATLLLQEALRIAAQLSLSGLDAEVHSENTASMRCFLSAGYREVGRSRDFTSFSIELE